ncbi:MAG: hypothetical protein WBW71_13460, partial [Bacteroidota bacterium]
GGKREQFSPGCVWESIASIPILRSSLCFFLWRKRKKSDFETIIQNESLPDSLAVEILNAKLIGIKKPSLLAS